MSLKKTDQPQKKKEKVPMSIKVIDMRVGQYGWMSCDHVAIIELPETTPKEYARVINLRGNVHPVCSSNGSVYIKRIGKGNLGEDFELDFFNATGVFDIFDTSPFTVNTTPYSIEPDFVTEQTVKMYYVMDDLFEELRDLFDGEQYVVSAKPVQDLLKIMIDKTSIEYQDFTLVKLLNKYFDNCIIVDKTNDFIKSEIDDKEDEEDIEYARAEIQLAHAIKANIINILKQKIPLDYHQYTPQRQQTIFEKINNDTELLQELEEVLLETIQKK